MFELTSDQTEKVLQFQDLTGIEDLDRCKQILLQNNWDFEISVRLTLDGNIGTNSSTETESDTNLRHRSVINNNSENQLTNNRNNNNIEYRRAETRLTVWSFTTRLLSLPFAFIYDTIISIIRFTLSLIRTDPIRNFRDTSGDSNRFIAEFELKYGSTHPVFFNGTYNQALDEAKRELKCLLVYLHSDSHEDTEEFCRTILTNQQFIDFLTQNQLIFWSSSVEYSEGHRVSVQLRESTYPYLALIGLKQNRMVVIKKFEGKTTIESLLTQLKLSIDSTADSLRLAREEREERNMNQLIRQQQDEAFAESLRADQEKERKKTEEKNKKEAEERAKKDKELEANQRKERLLELRESLVNAIPPEPDTNDSNATKIVIKLPNGTRLERRFLKTQSVKYLYYFVFCNKESPLNFQIRTNFPPRDLPGKPPQLEDFNNSVVNSVDTNSSGSGSDSPTFEECDLGKGAMLFVHDLEA